MNDSIARYSISPFRSTSSAANFPFSFFPFSRLRASFDCLLKREQLLCIESDVLISSIQMGFMISYVRMQGLEREGIGEFGMYSWQNRKGVSAEGRSGESMLKIIRARAMPYFSHVLVPEKKVADA